MRYRKSGLVLAAGLFAAIPVPSGVLRPVGVSGRGELSARYPASVREHYLSDEELGYVRPGLHVTVNSITNVGPGQNPVVDIFMTDDLGQPLDRAGVITPGEVEAEFIVARYNPDTRDYHNYTAIPFGPGAPPTPLHDVGGAWEDVNIGHSVYTFGLAMPADFDITHTATLGIYASRQLQDIIGKNYNAPAVVQYFRPDGGTPSSAQFDALDISACNTCHNPLSMHGQFGPPIQDVKLCVMCHTSEMPPTQNGESLNFKVFIHKIHRGENLPSVQAGTPYLLGQADFSTVALPQDIRNCQTCHSPAAAGYTSWYTYPSRASCGACHDDLDWTTGANHPGGSQANDSACANCHIPDSGHEWDASVKGAHTVPFKSTQLVGLNATIVSVTNTAPGQNPTIQFTLAQNDGTPINPASLGSSLNALMGGPTTDYAINPFREGASGAAFDGTTATYTFTHAIPADAVGTWAFTLEGRRTVTLNPHPMDNTSVTESLFNPVSYAAVTDSEPQPRRMVVDLANCNRCHDQLTLHGGYRKNTEMCVICHNPNENDSTRRPADQAPPESVDFKRMIHRIHTGEELSQNFTIYGFYSPPNPPNPINFNEVRFPGDRRDCEKCHAAGTEEVLETPPPALLPTPTPRDFYTPMQHYTTACLGCHDTEAAAAHAFVNTATFPSGAVVEACTVCHGEGAEFAVDQVHAR
jgi:OmcA/MtrC family decaheme c-type cytochrome